MIKKQKNKTYKNSGNLRFEGEEEKHMIIHEASHRDIKGIIKIDEKSKDIEWISKDPNSKTQKITIEGKKIIKVQTHEEIKREIMRIVNKNNEKYIFSFHNEDRRHIIRIIYEVLTRKYEDFLEHQYKNLSFINQRRITLLLTDNYLKKLFNKISNKKTSNQIKILKLDDFWNFIKKKYPNKLLFSLIDNKIQSSRADELELKISPIKFNFYIKKRILDNYSGVKIIFEDGITMNQSEDKFWFNFLKRQYQNGSEVIGGMGKIFFTDEEKENIKKKENENLNNRRNNHKINISKIYENVEYHMNYIDHYERNCLLLTEKDLSTSIKDSEITNENIINDYSIRKLEDIYYVPKIHYPKIYQDIPNKNSLRNLKKKENNKIEINNNEDITMINESEIKPKFNNILERLQIMENSQKELSESSYFTTFKRINKQLKINAEKKYADSISKDDLNIFAKIDNKINLYRDLKFLNDWVSSKIEQYKSDELVNLIKTTKKKLEDIKQKNSSHTSKNSKIISCSLNKI